MTRTIRMLAITSAIMMAAGAAELNFVDREEFLRNAKVVSKKTLSVGVTGSSKAMLRQGDLEHNAHVQTIDESRSHFESARTSELNFRDSYKFNIAAYEVAKMLGLTTVPASVERKVAGQTAAVTWWVDGAVMTDLDRRKKHLQPPNVADWNLQMGVVNVFDELIANTDRNAGNLVITGDWQIHMIDHTRAFRRLPECRNLKTIARIERGLLEKLRALDTATIEQKLRRYLNDQEIKGLLARRDTIVRQFESRIAAEGADTVTYELRPAAAVQAQ